MNLKKILIIVGVIAVVVIFILIKGMTIFNSAEFIEEIQEAESISANDEIIEENNAIIGEGSLTSFNIEQIDTSYWKNVDEVLFNDEDMVKANQLLLKTSNKDSKGEISSTINGRIYIQEQGGKDTYYIYDLDNIGIEFKVYEDKSVNLKIGQKAQITFTGSSEVYEGYIYYIQKIPVNEEVAVKVKLEYNDNLKFGTNGKVKVLTDEPIIENAEEFDIKNTTTKIGKTKIILNNSSAYGAQAFDMNALMEEYMNQMADGMSLSDLYGFDIDDPSQFEGDLPLEFESEAGTNVEELSKELSEQWNTYWNEYWNEYWKNYWKAYYEEYPIYIKEPNTEKINEILEEQNDETSDVNEEVNPINDEIPDENEDVSPINNNDDDESNPEANDENNETDNQDEGEE